MDIFSWITREVIIFEPIMIGTIYQVSVIIKNFVDSVPPIIDLFEIFLVKRVPIKVEERLVNWLVMVFIKKTTFVSNYFFNSASITLFLVIVNLISIKI